MRNVFRLLKHRLTTTRFDAQAGQFGCWLMSLTFMVIGIRRIASYQLTEPELLFGILLVMALTLLGVIAGLIIPVLRFVATQHEVRKS